MTTPPINIRPDEIHLWWAWVPDLADTDTSALLDDDEQARAARFVVDPPRHRFVAFRVLARRLLGAYTDLDPAAVRFTYGSHGKPALDLAGAPPFNAAHSGDVVVLAMTNKTRIGVDLELMRPMERAAALAERFFTAAEHAHVAALSEPERSRAFLHCWTCKEAVLKALGTGLSVPPHEVEVSPDPDRPLRVLTVPGGDPDSWSLIPVAAHPDYLCTIAIEGEGWQVVVRRYGE